MKIEHFIWARLKMIVYYAIASSRQEVKLNKECLANFRHKTRRRRQVRCHICVITSILLACLLALADTTEILWARSHAALQVGFVVMG